MRRCGSAEAHARDRQRTETLLRPKCEHTFDVKKRQGSAFSNQETKFTTQRKLSDALRAPARSNVKSPRHILHNSLKD